MLVGRDEYPSSMGASFEECPTLAPERTVVLISDLHLGDAGPTEPFARKDDLLRGFLEQIVARADALVIAGDGFDVAQAWSMQRICERHRALLDELVALDATTPVYYLEGNHEGSGRALAEVLPLRYCRRLRIGPRVLVEHGHAFDPFNQPGDRVAFWGSRVHAQLERVIRSPVRIPMRKHYCWSTRLGHWLFYRYGQWRWAMAGLYRSLGLDERARAARDFLDYWGRGEWGDMNGLLRAAAARLADPELDTLVCGHSHTAGVVALDGGTYVNTGSWTFQEATFAEYREGRFQVRRWPGGEPVGDEQYRAVLGDCRDKSFFDWWAAFYRGWLRYDVDAMERAVRGEAA